MKDNVIFSLNGAFGELLLIYDDRVVIEYKGMTKSLDIDEKEDKIIYYSEISHIKYLIPDLMGGYIQIFLCRERENKNSIFSTRQDENIVILQKSKENAYLSQMVIDYIEDKIKMTVKVVFIICICIKKMNEMGNRSSFYISDI